jgi:PAS domain S-box-containing protein
MRFMSAELARKLLEAAPDATVIIDETGTIRFSNRQATAMFGYAYNDIIGLSIEKLLPERFRARHVSHRQRFFDRPRVRPMGIGLDLFAVRKDGTEFAVEISLSPLEHDHRMLVAAWIRDVTERKHVDAEFNTARCTRAPSTRRRKGAPLPSSG